MKSADWILWCMLLLLVGCQSPTERLTTHEVEGIDVSHYQSNIDWARVAAQEIDFAYIKASEGETYKDSLFSNNWQQSKEAGIKRGAYHFYRPTVAPELQVLNFTTQVDLEIGDLPPVLDIEVLDGSSKLELLTGIQKWLYEVEAYYSIRPIIYTNIKFYNKYLAGHFSDYHIWTARYNTREPQLACGSDWLFWQYGNRGQLDGIRGDVDFNVFYGTPQDLEALCFTPALVFTEN